MSDDGVQSSASRSRFFLDLDGHGTETLWIETSRPDRPEPVITEDDRGIRNNPGAWAFLVSAIRAAGVGSIEGGTR